MWQNLALGVLEDGVAEALGEGEEEEQGSAPSAAGTHRLWRGYLWGVRALRWKAGEGDGDNGGPKKSV